MKKALASSSSANTTGNSANSSGNSSSSSGNFYYSDSNVGSSNGVWQQLSVDLESAVRTLGAPCGITLPTAAVAAHVRPAGGWKRFGLVAACGLFLVAASLSLGNNSAEQAVLAEAISPRRPNSAANGGGGGGNGVAIAVQSEGNDGSISSGGGTKSQNSHAAAVDAVLAHAEKARYRY